MVRRLGRILRCSSRMVVLWLRGFCRSDSRSFLFVGICLLVVVVLLLLVLGLYCCMLGTTHRQYLLRMSLGFRNICNKQLLLLLLCLYSWCLFGMSVSCLCSILLCSFLGFLVLCM